MSTGRRHLEKTLTEDGVPLYHVIVQLAETSGLLFGARGRVDGNEEPTLGARQSPQVLHVSSVIFKWFQSFRCGYAVRARCHSLRQPPFGVRIELVRPKHTNNSWTKIQNTKSKGGSVFSQYAPSLITFPNRSRCLTNWC